ncbi:helix-turn-helix domain-containing protein [uncultured Paracoccus sp.]|uniref:helix-turn-helix domain-containing protein n=1 Tax=uncultured Paracoccus sp. TaxID=189685 RepID=UPI0025ED1B53|nr:helix-turn-helix domain-containing protein [uncultured Paracoccus sp.]
MSHEATCWAVKQRGLKPAAKVILWHLADRHNPDFGCFPSQARLADDAEVSRASLNTHLAELETRGLIRRVQTFDASTKRQKNTRYILGFEADFAQDDAVPCPDIGHGTDVEHTEKPCPNSGHGAVSNISTDPCPENAKSRVQNLDTNLVREPLSKPLSAREARRGVDDLFSDFWAGYPHRVEETAARRAWGKVASAENAEAIIAAAEAYADDDRVKRGFPKSPANWLLDRCWQDAPAAQPSTASAAPRQPIDLNALSDLWAPKVVERAEKGTAGPYVPSSAISAALARHMVSTGAVTPDQLRKAGIAA